MGRFSFLTKQSIGVGSIEVATTDEFIYFNGVNQVEV